MPVGEKGALYKTTDDDDDDDDDIDDDDDDDDDDDYYYSFLTASRIYLKICIFKWNFRVLKLSSSTLLFL